VSELLTAMQDMTTTLATVETADDPIATCRSLRTTLDALDLAFLSKEVPSAISQSQEGLVRVSEIVKALKEFSHPGTGRIEVDINRAVASTTQVCRNEWRYVAEVDLELDPDLPTVSGFEGELKQVLLNILVNAAQAIGDDPSRPENPPLGLIKITTSADDEHAFVVITDNGPGMDETVQRRIFDPFFTTKDVGKGTGQGLSMAYSIIVQKHGGTLAVKSAPGQGATFTLGLPRKPPD
jgi:two-component system NtrC family sensor kinase